MIKIKNLSNENIIHVKHGAIEYIQFKRLLEYEEIVHCFTLKPLDFASFNNYEENKERITGDYKKICNELGIQYSNICRPKQTHTDVVKNVNDGDEGIFLEKFDDVDGFITNKNNKALTFCFADCTPLLFYDPIKKVIANTHSGWRGTYQTIGAITVEKMIKEYNCNPKDIICCIGPHIRKCHFEVKEDVKDMFYNKFKVMDNIYDIIKKQEGEEKYNIDTLEINKNLLLVKGLLEENIIDSKVCTVCNSDICHSFRVEKELTGRSIAIIEKNK